MRLDIFLVGAALAAVSRSFVIPDNFEDGVYVYNGATGNHTKVKTDLASRDLPPITNSAKFFGRASTPKITCGTTILSALDYASALQQLQKSCNGQTVSKHHNMYSKYGDAMVFMCNYAANKCSSSDLAEHMQSVNNECGSNAISDTTGKQVYVTITFANSVGYVRVNSGLSFGYTTAQESAC